MNFLHCMTLNAVILTGSLFSFAAKAQEQAPSVMNIHDCMEYAISNSTAMRIQAADRNDEQWQRRQAIIQAFTPYLNAQTYAYNQYGRNLDPETNTYNTVTTFYNGYSVSTGITLFNGFQAVNNIKMADTAMKLGISKEQQEQDRICLATMEAFANVIYWSEMESVVKEQVETARIALERAVRQEELGLKGHADVVQMESELAKQEYQLINSSNEKKNAIITLKDVMYWPYDEELLLDTEIAAPRCEDVDMLNLEGNAKALLPSARIASLQLRNATLDLKSARRAYSPSLGLYGGWSTTYYTYPGLSDYTAVSFKEQFKNNGGEYIQVQLSIPIFDQFKRRATLQKKKNALVRAEAEYDQAMRDIENEVRRAVNDRNGANAAFRQAERLAEVQQEAYRLSNKQFEKGMISAIEYQSASQTYLNATAEKLNSLLKLYIKDAVVRYYGGESYIKQQNQ